MKFRLMSPPAHRVGDVLKLAVGAAVPVTVKLSVMTQPFTPVISTS